MKSKSPLSDKSKNPLSGLGIVLWILGAALSFYLLFVLISIVFKSLPEPINKNADAFAEAAAMTLRLTVWSGTIGLVFGMLAGISKLSGNILIRSVASFYVWIIRGTPLLVQVLFVYNALPQILQSIHITLLLDEFTSGVVALSLNVGAYNAEVVRAGILAVPRGQTEASRSLGLSSTQTMIQITLPQAMRIVIPPLVNNLVGLLKDTSLVAVISLTELVHLADTLSASSFKPVTVWTTVAMVYLALTTVLTFYTNELEKRLQLKER